MIARRAALALVAALPLGAAEAQWPDAALQAAVGQSFFDLPWVQAPASTRARDGLGPLYNARACSSCHRNGGGGSPPRPDADNPALVIQFTTADPVYGAQWQPLGAGVAGEGAVRLAYRPMAVRLLDGREVALQMPEYRLEPGGDGRLSAATGLSPRLAPALYGAGRIEAVASAAIVGGADPEDRDGDGISGRVHWVTDRLTGEPRVGRFGLKATHPDLIHQVAAAFSADMGLTTGHYPEASCTSSQPACLARPDGANAPGEPEVPGDVLAAVAAFVARQPAPAAAPLAGDGAKRFAALGCASCHVPSLPGGDGQPVALYSDLLLHDLGPRLADDAGGEWRTPPLWGLGRRVGDRRGTALLHDGRARTVEEAVLWHGGEAQAAVDRYQASPPAAREALLQFLESL